MIVAGHPYNVLKPCEIEMLHRGALRILTEMGMEIQNPALLDTMAKAGYAVDYAAQRVRFPVPTVEQFIAESDRIDWDTCKPSVRASAGIYHGHYLDPDTNEMMPWNQDRLRFYCALARSLPEIGDASMLGCRIPVPPPLEPLYERYYAWKFGASPCGSIYADDICPHLHALLVCAAAHRKVPVTGMHAGTVHLVPMMKLGIYEAYQVEYFWKRGMRVEIGSMAGMGANAPVTFAGAAALNLAEQLALGMLKRNLFGDRTISIRSAVAMMDMKTMIYPYGRPEMAMMNVIFAQLARHYKASFSGHAGLTDAKTPSVEAGVQKALTAIPTLLAGGSVGIDAGLLSIDEVFSPVQMVLDNEFIGALKHFTKDFAFDEEAMGLETILECGPGGNYMDRMHTAMNFRGNAWEAGIWSRTMFNTWWTEGKPSDCDKARDMIRNVQASDYRTVDYLEPAFDKDLLAIIDSAKRALNL